MLPTKSHFINVIQLISVSVSKYFPFTSEYAPIILDLFTFLLVGVLWIQTYWMLKYTHAAATSCHDAQDLWAKKKKKDESKKLPILAAGNIAQPHCVKKLLCDHHPVLQISQTDFYAQIWWANRRLSPCFGQWDSFRVPPDCAVLLLVTIWRWVFDCGSLEWISGDKALVPVRGSHSGPCLLSHFPDKPNCISQECPGPKPCPAWPRRCLGGLQWLTPFVASSWCCQIGWYSRDTWVQHVVTVFFCSFLFW